jgi:hypothetical protein
VVARVLAPAAALGAGVTALLALLTRGNVTIDLGVGRTIRPLGPLSVRIEAPRETVFDILAAPYLGRTPRAMKSKLEVIERGEDMALAAHYTSVGRLVARTVETVRFERPTRIHFRLVRGPVPHVVEQFLLEEVTGATELEYRGELGVDLWELGRWWGDRVARKWEAAVRASLAGAKAEAERGAAVAEPSPTRIEPMIAPNPTGGRTHPKIEHWIRQCMIGSPKKGEGGR